MLRPWFRKCLFMNNLHMYNPVELNDIGYTYEVALLK